MVGSVYASFPLPNDMEAVKASAAQGDAKAQYKLGFLHEQGAFGKVDVEKAASWYEKAANAGNKDAKLALMLLAELTQKSGKAVSVDNTVTVKMRRDKIKALVSESTTFDSLEKSAKQGDSQAQFRMGTLYNNGIGMKQDANEAKKWYALAAEGGDNNAVFALDMIRESQGR